MVYMILIILIHSTYSTAYCTVVLLYTMHTVPGYMIYDTGYGTLYDTVTDVLNMNGNKLIKVKKVQYRSRRQRQKCYH
jgi:hypothetical protein